MGWGVRTEDNRAPSWQGSWVAQPSPGRPPPAVRPLARVPVVRAPPGSPPLWSSPRHEWASPLLQSLLLDPPSLCTCAGPAVFVHVCIQCRHPCSPSPPPCGQATLSSGLPPGGPSLLTHSPGQVPGRPRPTGVLPSPPCTDSLPRGHAADPALWLPCPPHPPHSPCSPYLTILGKILPPPAPGAPGSVCAVLLGQGLHTWVLLPDLCCDVGALWEGSTPVSQQGGWAGVAVLRAHKVQDPLRTGDTGMEGPSSWASKPLFYGEKTETQKWRWGCALTRWTHLSGQWLPEQRGLDECWGV